MPTTRKPIGRPVQGAEAKRHAVSCRVTPEVMAKLDAAIAENGRSLAQEIEARVAGHFRLEELFGDPRRLVFMSYLAGRIRQVEEKRGASFQLDPVSWVEAKTAVERVMDEAYAGPSLKSAVLRQMLEAVEAAEAAEAGNGA